MQEAGNGAARRLPSKSTGQGAHSLEERGPELYPTPPELVRPLLAVEPLPNAVWEPAAGMGDMVQVLLEAGHVVWASDLIDYGQRKPNIRINKRDFFEFEKPPLEIDTIITNPPFSEGANFVRHGLKLCKTVYVLNRLAFLEGVRKSDILDHKLARMYVFKERPPMMHRWSLCPDGLWREWQGKKSDSAMPFAWFVFERDYKGKGILTRRISWREMAETQPKKRRT